MCPGVGGEICTVCCGKEREATVTCPLDCEYLQDARKREKPALSNQSELPNRDIRVTERFLEEHSELLAFLASALLEAAFQTPGVTDFDIRNAIDALIRTRRTLQSGLYYETRPDNALAQKINETVQQRLDEFRKKEQQESGMAKTRDADILGVLVFFQRLELDRNNGRPRSRAFIDLLRNLAPAAVESPLEHPDSRLVLP
jgi:hypothetical protein